MQELQEATVSMASGVNHDSRGRPGDRQVTVLSRRGWQAALHELGKDVPWTTRRANLLVDDLDLENSTGSEICIGDLRLLITRETDPCSRMDDQYDGLTNALKPNWRGGVCCRVINDGVIRVGDTIRMIPAAN
jgi:MOSC domain-containing protein YiiM